MRRQSPAARIGGAAGPQRSTDRCQRRFDGAIAGVGPGLACWRFVVQVRACVTPRRRPDGLRARASWCHLGRRPRRRLLSDPL